MTTLPIDLPTAAHRWLLAYTPFTDLITSGLVGSDAEAGAEESEILEKAWVFQGLTDEGKPFRDPEGSGTSAVVLLSRRDWGTNDHNTARLPVLQVLIYTDSTRDSDGAVITRDADLKCKHIAKQIDGRLHLLKNPGDHNWSTLDVFSCVRAQGLDIMDVPQTEGLTVRGEIIYNAVTD